MDEPGGVILAHVMGLGKTLTTIAFLHTYLSIPPAQEGKARLVLVVVPANVLHNFFGEVSELFAWQRVRALMLQVGGASSGCKQRLVLVVVPAYVLHIFPM